MYISEDTADKRYSITAYDDASITVGGIVLRHSFLLFPEGILAEHEPQSFDELNEQHFARVLAIKPELFLIGSGREQKQLTPRLRYFLESKNIGVECMNTPAACRSYTVLLAEGRHMAALFFI